MMGSKYKPKTKPNWTVTHHKGRPTKRYLESLKRLKEVRKNNPSIEPVLDKDGNMVIHNITKNHLLIRYKKETQNEYRQTR